MGIQFERPKMWDSLKFFSEYILSPAVVGAVAPSSKALAREVIAGLDGMDGQNLKAVVEFGAGTGVFSRALLAVLPAGCKFVMVERNTQFAGILRGRFPGHCLHFDDVRNVRAICNQEGIAEVDCIISGLPWASFPDELQTECLEAMMTVLRPDGRFSTFAYRGLALLPPARKFRDKLHRYFREVRQSDTVLANLPPAFVYHCKR